MKKIKDKGKNKNKTVDDFNKKLKEKLVEDFGEKFVNDKIIIL